MEIKLWIRIGIALAVIYGWFGLFVTITTVIVFSAPIGDYFINVFAIYLALPFMIYPFWWIGLSFFCGLFVNYIWNKTKVIP